MAQNYEIVRFADIAAVACPCGQSRRAFGGAGSPASVHIVEIGKDSRPHYHRRLTEIYFILDGQGQMELDGARVAVEPGTAVMVKPLCRHRAVGELRVLNVVVPAFDPNDEWFDAETKPMGSQI
jgi:mannose-6-phosphate isomerase-like protein (cupin superfamily)